jgi:dCTP deaminase
LLLKAERLADLLASAESDADPLVIAPQPDLEILRSSGSASMDLRLGTWFLMLKYSREGVLRTTPKDALQEETRLTRMNYIPFGDRFYLHPGSFVLGVTLEWIRLPSGLAAYVIGRSSWGRRGLIIATATGVHPGFTGCLTLELSNVGEMPVEIQPGMTICQLFIHEVSTKSSNVDRSLFVGHRRPTLGTVKLDAIAEKLSSARHDPSNR